MRRSLALCSSFIIWLMPIIIVPAMALGCEVQKMQIDTLLRTIDEGLHSEYPTQVKIIAGTRSARILISEHNASTNRYNTVHEGLFKDVYKHPKYCEAILVGAKISLLVVEGVTNWQIIQILKSIEFLRGDVTDIPSEGMMAPHSYELLRGGKRQEVVNRMVARQADMLNAAWGTRADNLPLTNKSEALILASIIEKETSIPDERRLISSVFTNRLKRGMPLQTDSTVIYGITGRSGLLGRGLRRSELDRETPWNTYKIRGLPPTPIANPGPAAIEAALNPELTEYIFFVADGTGGHAFAATLAEHNRNVAAWRKMEAQVSNTIAVAKSCTSEPSSCSLKELCKSATYSMITDANVRKIWWRSDLNSMPYVNDAKRRGISCGVVEQTSCTSEPNRCSLQELCSRATYSMSTQSKETKIWWRSDLKSMPYVKDAERRGISCGVVDQREIERKKQEKIDRERQEKIERERRQELADRKQIIKDIQLHLNKHGCQAGVPDGIAGPKTKAAINKFLKAKNLTRKISNKELRSLLMKTSGNICVTTAPRVSKPPQIAVKPKPKKSNEDSLLCALSAGAAVATGGSSLLLLGAPGCFD